MRGSESEAIGELAGDALANFGALIKDLHAAIAMRSFEAVGDAAVPTRVIHDGIAGRAYDGVGQALKLAARAAARAAPAASLPVAVKAVLNGFHGDYLESQGNELALEMSINRHSDAPPSDRLVVFIHGLCETDLAWRGIPASGRSTYGERLERDLGISALYVRYNTGLPIANNGLELVRQLEQLIDEWPVPVAEVSLVGHSMGGLVAHSACQRGEGLPVTKVVCLGTPHLGADLEKGANALARALALVPETRGLGKVIDSRSTGIKDLRFGSAEQVSGASYYCIGAALAPEPVGSLLGDLLVRMSSALTGELENCCELAGLNHFDLLNHDRVYEQLIKWLEAGAHAPRPGPAHAPVRGAAHVPPRTTSE